MDTLYCPCMQMNWDLRASGICQNDLVCQRRMVRSGSSTWSEIPELMQNSITKLARWWWITHHKVYISRWLRKPKVLSLGHKSWVRPWRNERAIVTRNPDPRKACKFWFLITSDTRWPWLKECNMPSGHTRFCKWHLEVAEYQHSKGVQCLISTASPLVTNTEWRLFNFTTDWPFTVRKKSVWPTASSKLTKGDFIFKSAIHFFDQIILL